MASQFRQAQLAALEQHLRQQLHQEQERQAGFFDVRGARAPEGRLTPGQADRESAGGDRHRIRQSATGCGRCIKARRARPPATTASPFATANGSCLSAPSKAAPVQRNEQRQHGAGKQAEQGDGNTDGAEKGADHRHQFDIAGPQRLSIYIGNSRARPSSRPASASQGPAPACRHAVEQNAERCAGNARRFGMRRRRTSCQTAAASNPPNKARAGSKYPKRRGIHHLYLKADRPWSGWKQGLSWTGGAATGRTRAPSPTGF